MTYTVLRGIFSNANASTRSATAAGSSCTCQFSLTLRRTPFYFNNIYFKIEPPLPENKMTSTTYIVITYYYIVMTCELVAGA